MTTPQIIDSGRSTTSIGCCGNKIVQEFHVHFDCEVMRANAHRLDASYIESETMIVDSTRWKIRAYPNDVQFFILWNTDLDIEVDVKVHVLAQNFLSNHCFIQKQVTLKKDIDGEMLGPAFAKSSMMNGSCSYIVDNQFKLTLTVELNRNLILPMAPLVNLSKTVSERLFHKATSDVDIVAEGTHIPAHKLILSMASPVFTAMFENQMQESVTNEIVISDFSEEVVRSMLRCIYDWSCVASEVEKYPEQLLCIANKYKLTAIENVASDHIIEAISVDNVIETLLIADKFDRLRVKDAAMDYITVNADKFFTNPDFQRTLGYDLIFELFAYMATNKRVK